MAAPLGDEINVEEDLFMAEHLAKNHDKASSSAFLLFAGKHRVSPLHSSDLLRKALASSQPNAARIVSPRFPGFLICPSCPCQTRPILRASDHFLMQMLSGYALSLRLGVEAVEIVLKA